MTPNQKIGNKIKEFRLKAKLSQEDVGNALGKSHATISDIERGKNDLTINDLALFADLFKTSIYSFFDNMKLNYTVVIENGPKNLKEESNFLIESNNLQSINYFNRVY